MKYTFNADGWTDWITHDHKGCPCVGWYVRLRVNTKHKVKSLEGIAVNNMYWLGDPECVIEEYKVRKPLGASNLEEMLKDLPKTVDKSLVKT